MAPTVGYKVNDWLNIGGALNIVAFKHLRIASFFGDDYLVPDAGGDPDGQIRLNTDTNFTLPVPPYNEFDPAFDEFGFTLGIQLKPTDRLSLGLVYREELPTTFSGKVSTNLTGETLTDRYEVDFHMPRHIQFGTAYDVIPNALTLSADVQWTNWSNAKGPRPM